MKFRTVLDLWLKGSLHNKYGKQNYAEGRFGSFPSSNWNTIIKNGLLFSVRERQGSFFAKPLIYFNLSMIGFDEQSGKAPTVTIDQIVKSYNIEKVDFIKMNIEGAELYALKGVLEAIKKFRPKLAIAIYHSMSDFTSIPKWILDLSPRI